MWRMLRLRVACKREPELACRGLACGSAPMDGDVVGYLALWERTGSVVHPHKEYLGCLARLRPDRDRRKSYVDSADVLIVMAHDSSASTTDRCVAQRIDQVGGHPVDEAVTIRRLHPCVVMRKSNHLAVGADANE